MTLTALCVQHDANHGAYFRKARYNHLLGWTADALLGFSSYAWRVKHNVSHHTYTNVDGCDDDVSQVPLARFAPTQQPRPWYRFQHYYIWLLYTLLAVRWQTAGDLISLARGRFAQSALRFPRGWNLAALLTGKAVFFSWTLVVPLFFYPWWVVGVVYLGWAMIFSLVMATTFQLAHCVEEASFVSRDELIAERRVWAVHEVETTVNFSSPQSHPHLGSRRAQLPDRAPPIPWDPAHALSGDRTHRAKELPQARRAVHESAIARVRASLAFPTFAAYGAARLAGVH